MSALEYNPAIYDTIHRERQADIAWYVRLCENAGGEVLEIGAGTGRVAVPVARKGISIWALEIAPEMRRHLAGRLAREDERTRDALVIVEGEMTSFSLGRRFALIQIPFRTFLHNTTRERQLACLARCHEHLEPQGLLAFDVFAPSETYMARFSGVFEGISRMDDPYPMKEGGHLLLTESNSYDRAQQTVRSIQRYDLAEANGRIGRSSVQILELAFLYPGDLHDLLGEVGFADVRIFGDFKEQPVGQDTLDLAILATKP